MSKKYAAIAVNMPNCLLTQMISVKRKRQIIVLLSAGLRKQQLLIIWGSYRTFAGCHCNSGNQWGYCQELNKT